MLKLRAAYAIIPQIHVGKSCVTPEEICDLGQAPFVNLFRWSVLCTGTELARYEKRQARASTIIEVSSRFLL